MSTEPLFTLRNPWFTAAVGSVVVVAAAAAVTGFLWLPSLQASARAASVWDMICTAAGLVRTAPAAPVVPSDVTLTQVVLTPGMLAAPSAMSIGRGGTLALQCTMCHGARGISEAESPNLAGQYASVIFKQLQDYRSGARVNAVMSPRVVNLTDQDIRDIAAYYAYLPRLPSLHPLPDSGAPPIVATGAPMRNIPPCGACHGDVAHTAGSPWLDGESPVYLRAQLEAFASGARHNDIDEQMRNVARNMTPAEIQAAADYYGGRP
jgi:cytochrome c553